VGINDTSPDAMLDIMTRGTTVVGQIIQGSASQTADLLRILDSSATELFIVDSNGDVGVGTNNPATQIHIKDSGNAYLTIETTSTGANEAAIDLETNFGGTDQEYRITNFEGDLFFYDITDARFIMTLDGDGNVGIGNTNPSSLLTVNGTASALNFVATSTTATSTFAGGLAIETSGFVYDFSTGFVGIGTAAPTNWLQINSGALPNDSQFMVTADGASAVSILTFAVDNNGIFFDAHYDAGVWVSADAGSNFGIYKGGGGSDKLSLVYDSSVAVDGAITWNTGMVMDTSGQVGISTTSPWRTLSVTGTVGFDGLTLNTGAATASVCLSSDNEITQNTDNETCVASSERYKENITDSTLGLSDLSKLRPVSFEYIENEGVRYGFIAEEVELINPQFVSYDEEGTPNGIRWSHITALTVSAVAELNLNLSEIASTNNFSTPESQSFAESFFSNLFARITTWLADAVNGVKRIVVEDEICVDGECLTKDDIRNILELVAGQPLPSSSTPDTSSSAPSSAEATEDREPPTITILGNNPANISIGDEYSDMGGGGVF